MNKLLKRGLLAATTLAVPASALLAMPLAAHASVPSTVKAVTYTQDHVDTTSVSGPGTINTTDGPQWAYDKLTFTLTGVKDSADTWSVTVAAKGFYEAVANPVTGATWEGYGSVNGWLNYEVQSTTVPSAKYIPAGEQNPATSQTEIVNQLFNGHASIIGGGHYDYQYSGIPGEAHGIYTQVG